MVQGGQFLERPTLIPSGGYWLEGHWHRGKSKPALLICPPHPRRGGSMDSPICAELAFAATQGGHPSLRFNYRGAGASEGPLSELADCVEDARAALSILRENTEAMPVLVAGVGFGAEVAAALAQDGEGIDAVAVISPDAGHFEPKSITEASTPALMVLGERDESWSRLELGGLLQGSGDRLTVIEGADRLFTSGLPAMGREVVAFLKERAG